MNAIAYSDPNCPYCYATEERLHGLGLADRVEWRGVQHAPWLPVPTAGAGPRLAAELRAEVDAIRRLAPEIGISQPTAKPNTAAAIRFAAAAMRTDAKLGRQLVRDLYRGFWIEGLDLADRGVLASLATAAGLPPIADDPRDTATTHAWQAEWEQTGLAGVPLLIRDDGEVLYGLVAASELNAFMSGRPRARRPGPQAQT